MARSFSASSGNLRRANPYSNSSLCLRIHLMSCMPGRSDVMARLAPAIYVFVATQSKTWMPGTRPGMTNQHTSGTEVSPRSFRRLGGSAGGVLGLVGGRFLLDPAHRPDRALIKRHQWQRAGELAEPIARGAARPDHQL